jgi:DNA-binding IclR family transcriptional regulator
MESNSTQRTLIHSVLKALDILQLFSTDEPRLSLMEISQRLHLPKSTTHNLLNTLLSRRFIEKSEDGRYALGPEIIALTQAVRINVELRNLAAPVLRDLSDACRESAYLTVLDGDACLYIYAVESPRRLRARTAVGDRAHLHCTAVGKALLSGLSDEEIALLAQRVGLPRFTENTITTVEPLLIEVAQSRLRGYAVDQQEHEWGNFCVGAPIRNGRGRVIAACSAAGTDPQILGDKLPEFVTRVTYAAQEISRYMGYVPPRASAVIGLTPVNGATLAGS